MCIMVYFGADAELALIPWQPRAPSFHTRPLSGSEHAVKQQFRAEHVVFAGGHEQCGCGFQVGDKLVDDAERELRRRVLHECALYLRDQLTRCAGIEVHACWAGDENKPVEQTRELRPSSFAREEFLFLEREHSIVVSE